MPVKTPQTERPAIVTERFGGRPAAGAPPEAGAAQAGSGPHSPAGPDRERTDGYYDTKSQVFAALDRHDRTSSQLAKLDAESRGARKIRDIVNDIIAIKKFAMSIAEQERPARGHLQTNVLGYGPLEPLLGPRRSGPISWSTVPRTSTSKSTARSRRTTVRFRDNQQLLNICQRIVSQVGRRVDESSPICDVPDSRTGSRVNVIAPPLASMARR